MREQFPNPEEPNIEAHFVAAYFDLPPGSDGDAAYGVPEEVAAQVAAELMTQLDQANIAPHSVVFSGYNMHTAGDEDKLREVKEEAQGVLRGIANQAQQLEDEGGMTSATQARLQAEAEEARRVMRDAVPVYHFGEAGSLQEDEASQHNPIHFAGTAAGALIGVYDKRRLAEIDPAYLPTDATEGAVSIRARGQRIAEAKILSFIPMYRVNE